MTEPLHHLGDALHPRPLGQLRSRDHDDGQAERTRGVDLGARAVAAGIAGDDPFDAARAHHLQLAVERERSARHDHIGIERQRRSRADRRTAACRRAAASRANGAMCCRPMARNTRARCSGKRGDGGSDVRDLDPVVAGHSSPRARVRARSAACRFPRTPQPRCGSSRPRRDASHRSHA